MNGGPRLLVEDEVSILPAICLHRWAWDGTIAAENAAIAWLWPQLKAASTTTVEVKARIERHGFRG